VPRIITNKSHA